MNPRAIAGDSLSLDIEAARKAIAEHVAQPLGLDLMDAAYGILQVVNATMMRSLRAVSTERGRDPRDFLLELIGDERWSVEAVARVDPLPVDRQGRHVFPSLNG